MARPLHTWNEDGAESAGIRGGGPADAAEEYAGDDVETKSRLLPSRFRQTGLAPILGFALV